MAMQTGSGGKVDRQTTCPFHLKLFYRTGGFHKYAGLLELPWRSPNIDAYNRLDDFPISSTTAPLPSHLQIYTWPTCTLRELSHLLTTALPSLLPAPSIGTRLAYRLVYPDTRPPRPGTADLPPRYLSKEIGNVVIGGDGPGILPTVEEKDVVTSGVMSGELQGEPDKTLADARFVIGDYVDCAIFEPLGDGSVAPMPRADFAGGNRMPRGGGGIFAGPPRENGFGGGYGRGRGGPRGGYGGGERGGGRLGEGVPSGEWRRGERIPDVRGYGRGRGRGD
ncbi:MAG: hypothetical protein L6R38_000229 [Xanthoria sp. 2 TBL-2021]|nr:MAG: hypothetical protein L6R38_000229 [Xanthoria sp. 2 TBL-2021]